MEGSPNCIALGVGKLPIIERLAIDNSVDGCRELETPQLIKALVDARTVVTAAYNDAARIVLQAEREATSIRQAAEVTGFDAGQRMALHTILSGAQFLPQFLSQLKELVIDVATAVAQAVLRSADPILMDALRLRTANNLSLLEANVARHKAASKIAIHVSPDETESVEQHLAQLKPEWRLEIVADSSLAVGDMVIVSGLGRIDGRTSTHIEILSEFLGHSQEMMQRLGVALKELL